MEQIFFYACCFSLIQCLLPLKIYTETDQLIPCTKEELMMFFPKPIVKEVLIKGTDLSEEEAENISKELVVKDQGLVQLVDEKAARYNPNPFHDLSQRDKAVRIYQETLFEVFAEVLKKHGLNDEKRIHALLENVRSIKSHMFVDCIRKQQVTSPEFQES